MGDGFQSHDNSNNYVYHTFCLSAMHDRNDSKMTVNYLVSPCQWCNVTSCSGYFVYNVFFLVCFTMPLIDYFDDRMVISIMLSIQHDLTF